MVKGRGMVEGEGWWREREWEIERDRAVAS